MDEPSSARLRIVKSRISSAAWAARVKAARRDEEKLLAVLADVEQGVSVNEAIRRHLPRSAANPPLTLDEAVAILERRKLKSLPSLSTIARIFKKVDSRLHRSRNKARTPGRAEEVIEEDFAGGELLLAAEMQTDLMAALTDEVEAYGEAANVEANETYIPDLGYRDRKGQFTKTYNRKRRRKRGEQMKTGPSRPSPIAATRGHD
jgi:hypothetical protein